MGIPANCSWLKGVEVGAGEGVGVGVGVGEGGGSVGGGVGGRFTANVKGSLVDDW